MNKMMLLNKNKQQWLLLSIYIAVVGLSLGYAALQETLTINAEATVGAADENWKIYFDEADEGITTGTAEKGQIQLTNTDVTINGVKLKAPGDSVTYTFYVKNDGTIDAELGTYTPKEASVTGTGEQMEQDQQLVTKNYEYKLEYADDGGTIAVGNELTHGDSKKIKLTITYKDTADSLPTKEVSITNLGATLVYKQKTSA